VRAESGWDLAAFWRLYTTATVIPPAPTRQPTSMGDGAGLSALLLAPILEQLGCLDAETTFLRAADDPPGTVQFP